MRKKYNNRWRTTYWRQVRYALSFMGCAALLSACNKEFPNRLLDYQESLGYQAGTAKVLFIMADGLRGTAVQDIQPTALMEMAESSMFAYHSLVDFGTHRHTAEIGWANLLTGTTSNKHGVIDEDLDGYDYTNYPHLFDRLAALDTSYQLTGYSSSEAFSQTFLSGTINGGFVASDQAVFDGVNQALIETDGNLFFAHFSALDQAGQQSSYESDDPLYRSALGELDGRISELVRSIASREAVETENWLIVITGSSGGPIKNAGEVDNTVFGDPTRGVFTMFYSPKFGRKFYPKPNGQSIPYLGSAVRFTYGDRPTNAVLDEANLLNFGTDRDFTISFNFKSNVAGGNWNYPVFVSKRDVGFSGPGWSVFGEVRNGAMALGVNSSIAGQAFSAPVNDGNWHNYTLSVSRGDSIRVFTDGVFSEAQATNTSSVDNGAPLVLGKKVGNDNSSPDVLISNLQIYDVAWNSAEVAAHAGKTHVDTSHPLYPHLIGYWPGYDDIGTTRIRDLSGHEHHMRIQGDYNWVSFNDIVPYFTPPVSDAFYRIVPNSVDVPFMIYQWCGIIPQEDWGLDGKSWTPEYKSIN